MGQGPLLPNIARKVAELGLDRQVDIRGFVPRQELLNMMLRSSIFVIPSYYEGLPTSALEAMGNVKLSSPKQFLAI
jgi:glycosyltransferase involved in cell wall biosynthesis